MSYEEFWHGEAYLATAYREADKARRDRQHLDYWMMGRYVEEAILATAHVLNPFAKKKMHDYPDKPYLSTSDKQAEEDSMAANVQAFEALAISHNAAIQRKLDNEG